MSKNETVEPLVGGDASAYRYANSRPFAVFGLAIVAAIGASSMVWGAWSVLDHAESAEEIASPPDLKLVMEAIGERGRSVTNSFAPVKSESNEGESSFSGEDTNHEQAINQSV